MSPNLKVVAMLAVAVAAVVVVVYPGALRYAPYIVFLACPLMMVFMMGGHSDHAGHTTGSQSGKASRYVCPMHPEITRTFAAKCPRCGMALVPLEQPSEAQERLQSNPNPAGGEWGHEH